jgi:membrane-associated phospholipid phosphatase
VYLGMHFPSDVLVGAGMGAALGLLARRLARRA